MCGGDLLPRFPQYGSLVPRVQSEAGREYIWRGCEPPGVPQYPLHLRARWRRSNASFFRRKRNEALRPCPPDTPQHYLQNNFNKDPWNVSHGACIARVQVTFLNNQDCTPKKSAVVREIRRKAGLCYFVRDCKNPELFRFSAKELSIKSAGRESLARGNSFS